jgi:hypothetical protein
MGEAHSSAISNHFQLEARLPTRSLRLDGGVHQRARPGKERKLSELRLRTSGALPVAGKLSHGLKSPFGSVMSS